MSLVEAVRACSACPLRQGVKAPVPGEGPPHASVMLVGEAPGKDEDATGRPFTGQAGRLLDSLLQSIGVARDEVYVTNTVKCIVGSTPVGFPSPPMVGYRRHYEGTVISIQMAGGHVLTVTPNHPVLTRRGWVRAELLHQGEDAIYSYRGERCPPVLPNIDNMPSTAEQVFRSLQQASRTCGIVGDQGDFHGDGANSEIEVVGAYCHLLTNLDSSHTNEMRHLAVTSAGKGEAYLRVPGPRQRPLTDSLIRPQEAAPIRYDTCCASKADSLHVSQLGPIVSQMITAPLYTESLSFTVGAAPDPSFSQPQTDSAIMNAEALRYLQSGLSSLVTLDNIDRIERHWFSGHVYNFFTDQGWYIAHSIIVHNCRPPGNRTPTKTEAEFCSNLWLKREMEEGSAEVVVALGVTAARAMRIPGSMENIHGRPTHDGTRVIFPVYHPAAGLHETSLLRTIQEDFRGLQRVLRGEFQDTIDIIPHPSYQAVTTPQEVEDYFQRGEIAIDVETVGGALWSVQASKEPGDAIFIPASVWQNVNLTHWVAPISILHNYLYDARFIKVGQFADTMVAAYLLGLPQGLKVLARTEVGMEMATYSEVTRPFQIPLAVEYLEKVAARTWPDPPAVEDAIWKDGAVTTRIRHRQNVAKKVRRILADTVDKGVDPWERWQGLDLDERIQVERALGPMLEADLSQVPIEDAVTYSCRDADATLRVWQVLKKRIREMGLEAVFWGIDLPILPIVLNMMQRGMAVDLDHLRSLTHTYATAMEDALGDLTQAVGRTVNPSSRPQVAELVYGRLGFSPTRLTPGGAISTDDGELRKIDHPAVKAILGYRHYQKLVSTYTKPLVQYAVDDGDGPRIHSTIKVTRTETGRLSMGDPVNLQNIPARSAEGAAVRDGFIAPHGSLLVSMDYSQIEMRVAAHLSQCKRMIRLFQEGRDIHTENAAVIFGVPVSAVTDHQRRPAKDLGFGVLYGITPAGLLQGFAERSITGWDLAWCTRFIKEYYRLHPELRDWQLETIALARRQGFVRDMFGRIRYIPELHVPLAKIAAAGERQAVNMPIQASAQGIIKIAMSALEKATLNGSRCVLQVHDELLFEVKEDTVPLFIVEAKRTMEECVGLSVPLVVNSKQGLRWGSLV